MRVNLGQAKTDLSKLLARAEAGEEIEIARLVRIDSSPSPGERFLAARGSLRGRIPIGDNFEFSDKELEELLDEAV